jgi:hypothetical protein
VDLKKAFDRVDRRILMKKLVDLNLEPPILLAVKALLSNTNMEIDNKKIKAETGVP